MRFVERKGPILLLGGLILSLAACSADTAFVEPETETIIIESRQIEPKTETMEQEDAPDRLDIMKEHSFLTEFDDWGMVEFVTVRPSEASEDVTFHLMEDDQILYTFPGEFENNRSGWIFEDINFVAFRDIDGDEKLDVMISADYIKDEGAQAAIPIPHVKIYNRIPDGFELNERLSNEIDNAQMSDSFAQVTEYIEAYDFDLFYSKSQAITFAETILSCLREDDREQMSRLISFPITINLGDQKPILNDQVEFLDYYERIFDDEFKNKLLQYDPENIGRSYAIFLGNGEIWFSKTEEGYKIFAINNALN